MTVKKCVWHCTTPMCEYLELFYEPDLDEYVLDIVYFDNQIRIGLDVDNIGTLARALEAHLEDRVIWREKA